MAHGANKCQLITVVNLHVKWIYCGMNVLHVNPSITLEYGIAKPSHGGNLTKATTPRIIAADS